MSETPAPYRATPDAPAFTPRPVRFRVWDGERMWYPGDEGNPWKLDPNGEVLWNSEHYREECVPMQSTGLHDADGREIYEGDVVEWNDDAPGVDLPPRRGTVAWGASHCGFGLDAAWREGQVSIGSMVRNYGGRVVGNAFQPPA